jgi:hypothetical protein
MIRIYRATFKHQDFVSLRFGNHFETNIFKIWEHLLNLHKNFVVLSFDSFCYRFV